MSLQIKIKSSVIILLLVLGLGCHGQSQKHEKILELKKEIQKETYPKIDGIIVAQSDKIIVEEYFGKFDKNTKHDTRSAFKSITSILAGIAIDQGIITLENKVLKYFPEYKNKNAVDKKKEAITIKDLLEMKAGFDCEEFYGIGPDCESEMEQTKDWVNYAIDVPMKDQPGKNWAYNSNEPMIMGAVISKASGLSIMDFSKKYLFEPLGISDYKWTTSPKGQGMTAGSFFMKPTDMLKIGKLVDQKGQWNGKQIVSKDWITQSTDCQIDIDFSFARYSRIKNAKYTSATYGFYWYKEQLQYDDIDTEVLFASGNGGQYIMILKEYDTVIVFTGSNYNNWRNKLPFEITLKYLIPMLKANG